MPTVGNGPDRSARQPNYRRAGALLPPQTSNPESSFPLEGKVSAEQTDEVFFQKPVIYKRIPQSFLTAGG